MNCSEDPVIIDCAGLHLLGILHRPSEPRSRAVLIVVGGPQFRVGSHRQFLLLARYLSERGTPVLRFDCRGMGDSDGAAISFEELGPDIRAAIDTLFERITGLDDVVIWGLCDAASAAMMYAYQDRRVSGLILLNPWVRGKDSLAKTYLRRHYKSQILDFEFWKRLLTGKVKVLRRVREFLHVIRHAYLGRRSESSQQDSYTETDVAPEKSYIYRMQIGLKRFKGRVLLIMSGDDLTASEFDDCVSSSRQWQKLLLRPSMQRRDIVSANHTFSRQIWRDQVSRWTDEWSKSW